jgi:hypothetical protein
MGTPLPLATKAPPLTEEEKNLAARVSVVLQMLFPL